MTIAQKGLSLILLLSVLELTFVSALFFQLQSAESQAREESRQKDLYRHTQKVSRGLYSGHELLMNWQSKPGLETARDIRKTFDDVLSNLDYLKKNGRHDSQQVQMLDLLRARSFELFKDIYANTESLSVSSADQSDAIARFMERTRGTRGEVQNLAIEFMKIEQKRNDASPSAEQDLIRKNLEFIVLIGLSANVVLAFLLAQFFSNRINSKLQVVLDNTVKLKELKPLNPPLKGNDEICRLDESFHFMANKLIEHERLRRAYANMFREELQSPLNEVFNNISSLSAGKFGEMTEPAQKMLLTASSNLRRLIGIVDTLTENDSGKAADIVLSLSETSLQKILDESLASVREFAARYKVKLESEIEDCLVVADSDRLVQVLVNLLSNASKFSPPDSVVRIQGALEEKFVRVSVIDNGRGIPSAKQNSIFEKFQQAEVADGKRGTGTGLGLNICKTIVELHAGQIGVESEEGKGSRFWFRIPKNGPKVK